MEDRVETLVEVEKRNIFVLFCMMQLCNCHVSNSKWLHQVSTHPAHYANRASGVRGLFGTYL
jgi:hypothetical protein